MDRLGSSFKNLTFNPLLVRKTSSRSYDEILASSDSDPALVRALTEIDPFRIRSGLRRTERTVFAQGGYGDVYQGELLQGWKKVKVAIKVLRFNGDLDYQRLLKRLAREVYVWSTLKHVNVLEFVGFEVKGGPSREESSLICPWMENGDIKTYLMRKPYCRRRRLMFLLDTLDGLMYLHAQGVYHGDLKAANILISPAIRAVLCDFGVSRYMIQGDLTTSEGFKGSVRWTSPEQLNSEHCIHTASTDAWSWAMTALEIMTGEVPYHTITVQAKLYTVIAGGQKPDPLDYPSLPDSDPLWTILRKCWKTNPDSRRALPRVWSTVSTLMSYQMIGNSVKLLDPRTRKDAITSLAHSIEGYPTVNRCDMDISSCQKLAIVLTDLGVYLAQAGRYAEALHRQEEAVMLWQSLSLRDPETFNLELVQSVHLLSKRLAAAGRWNEGLEQAQQGHAMIQMLTKEDPEAFRSDRAVSLLDLSDRLVDTGRRDEALRMAKEAVSIYAELFEGSRGSSEEYITFLLSFSSRLQDVGRRKEALEQARKAHELAQALSGGALDLYQSTLASCLDRLCAQRRRGKQNDALNHGKRAVEIWRELVANDPQAFHPELAASLTAYGTQLHDLGIFGDALAVGQEGVSMWRRLVEQEPTSYHPGLSKALSFLSVSLRNMKRYESALEYIQEALVIQERLADEVPDRFLPHLGVWCERHSDVLKQTGRLDEATTAARRAVDIMRPFADKHPDVFQSKFKRALATLSECLVADGKLEDAVPHLCAAIELDKGEWGLGPIGRRRTLATCLSGLGENDSALRSVEEAVGMARKWVGDHPDSFRQDCLALSLDTSSACLMNCQRSDEAIQRGREAMDIYEGLAQQQPEPFLSNYTRTSEDLIRRLQHLNRIYEALQITERVTDLRRQLSA